MSKLRRLVAPLAIILTVASLSACVAYSEPGPAYYRGGYYYGPSYYSGGVYVHEGHYRRW